jgi:two-component system sensor histidine kinase YesM
MMIIIPLLLAGICISVYFLAFSVDNSYQSTWQMLDRALEKLETQWRQTEGIRDACIVNYPLQRLGSGEPERKDYVDAKDFLEEFVKQSDIYENICVVENGGILMQGGMYVENMEEGFHKNVEEYFADNPGSYDCWIVSGGMQRSPYVKYSYSGGLLTYCGLVDSFLSKDFSQTLGILYVSVREEELYHVYGDYLADRTLDYFLMDARGNILSAKNKEGLGTQMEEVGKFEENLKKNGEGSFWSGGRIYIYKYSSVIDGYLVSVYSYMEYFSDVILVCAVIGMATLICMFFVLVYILMQKKYIVRPIYELVGKFGQIEGGDMQLIDYDGRNDEIGILQLSYNKMVIRLEEMIEEIRQIGDKKKEAELQALISQINPHFLYNTLDSIHWKAVLNRDAEVAEQVLLLSDVYRYVLSRGKEFITFREEFAFQEKYLSLMKMRFGERLQYGRVLEQGLEEMRFPKLILQPLLENAMIHGIEPKVEGGKISICVCRDGGDVCVRVEDTGVGFPEDVDIYNGQVENLSGSVAIKNVYSRLCLYYKEAVSFAIHGKKGQGCQVEIRVREEAMGKGGARCG